MNINVLTWAFLIFLGLMCFSLIVFIIIKLKNKTTIKQIIPIWVLMLFAGLIGIIFITYGSLLDVKFIPTPKWSTEFRRLIVSIFYNLGQALFVAGIVGVIFEMKSIKGYFEKSISDILIGDEYLKFQDEGELMRLRQRATTNIYLKKSKQVDLDLIKLDEDICAALTEPHFEYYQENSSYVFDESNTFIIKTVKTRFKLVNPKHEKVDIFEYLKPKIRFKNIKGVKDDEIRTLKGFDIWVDGENPYSVLELLEIKSFTDTMHELDDEYGIKTELALKNHTQSSQISFVDHMEAYTIEERKIPLNDLTVSFRLETLAKNFKIGLVFEEGDIELIGNIYGTMSNPRNGINIDTDSNSISLESKKWMLKGNGVFINIVPKNWEIKKKSLN